LGVRRGRIAAKESLGGMPATFLLDHKKGNYVTICHVLHLYKILNPKTISISVFLLAFLPVIQNRETMETTINSELLSEIAPLPEKPQFLKVLCILTWICCGLIFISTVFGMLSQSPERAEEQLERLRETSPEMADQMESIIEAEDSGAKTMNNVLTLVALAFSTFGALLMWQLKKIGFYLYIVGELLPYVAMLAAGAKAMSALLALGGGLGGTIATVVLSFMVILDLAFIIMYGVNLKYMNK